MNNRLSTFWFIIALGVTMPRVAFALDLSYSGRIVEETGAPSPGPIDLTLRFFGSEKGSDQLGTALVFSQVPLVDGVFQISLKLDAEAQADVFGDGTRQVFVEMEARGKVYPRQSFAPVPLALRIPIDTGHFEFAGEASKLTLRPLAIEQVLGLREELDNNALPTTISDNKLATITAAGKVAGSAITAGTISGSTAFAGSGGITTTGPIVSSGHVTINSTGSAATELRFADRDGSHYLGFKAPATVTTNRIWTLPADDGAAGSFLKTDGEGNLAWITADGGGDMYLGNNLSDLPDKPLARTNLGLGSIATLSIIDSLAIANETVVDADIAGSANIATSKLSGSVLSIAGHGLGSLASTSNIGSIEISDLSIIDTDISQNAAIATAKLSGALLNVTNHGLGALAGLSEVGSAQIAEQSIVNADIASQAGISTTKLSGTAFAISNHGLGALASASSINSALIDNGVISNVHIAPSAAIATSKLSGPLTAVVGNGLGTLATTSSIGNANIETGAAIDATKLADGSVSSTEFQYLSNVTSDVQTQLNSKVNAANPTFTGGISVALGSSAAPSYTFTGDPNTGLWSATADILSMGTAGSERMTITASGNVGIGTTTPAGLLDVNGKLAVLSDGKVGIGTTSPVSLLDVTGATRFYGGYGTLTSTTGLTIGSNGSTPDAVSLAWGNNTGWKAHFGTNVSSTFTPRMTLVDTGNVGIGTTDPKALLSVYDGDFTLDGSWLGGSTSKSITVKNSQARLYIRSVRNEGGGATYGELSFSDYFSAADHWKPLALNPSGGGVGIGTTAPTSNLHVAGASSANIIIDSSSTNTPARRSTLTLYSQDTAPFRALGILTKNATQENWFIGEGYDTFGNLTFGYGASQPEYRAQSKLMITTTGGVGIGTTSPAGKLDVAGSICLNGANCITSWPAGSVTSVTAGTGLTGGPITASGSLSLANTSVTPGSYTRANITVDAQGRLTAATSSNNIALTNEVTGTLPIANGGTGATLATSAFNALSPLTTLGDLLYGGASGAGTRLAGNMTATKQFLTSTGSGGVATAPAWGGLAASDIPAHSATLISFWRGTRQKLSRA